MSAVPETNCLGNLTQVRTKTRRSTIAVCFGKGNFKFIKNDLDTRHEQLQQKLNQNFSHSTYSGLIGTVYVSYSALHIITLQMRREVSIGSMHVSIKQTNAQGQVCRNLTLQSKTLQLQLNYYTTYLNSKKCRRIQNLTRLPYTRAY